MSAMLEPLVDKVVQVITNDGRNIVGLLKVPAQPRTPPDAAAVPYLIASSATTPPRTKHPPRR